MYFSVTLTGYALTALLFVFPCLESTCSPQASKFSVPDQVERARCLPGLLSYHLVPAVQKSVWRTILISPVSSSSCNRHAFLCIWYVLFSPSLLDNDSIIITVVQISKVQTKSWVGYTSPEQIQSHQEIFMVEENVGVFGFVFICFSLFFVCLVF